VIKIKEKRIIYLRSQFEAREEQNGEKILDGLFIPYNQETELWRGFYEEIASGAFTESLRNSDIRVLYNHNSDIVLGREKSHTAVISERSDGVYCKISINQSDTEALNIYERVKRGDISGNSFGFYPTKEIYRDKGNDEIKVVVTEGELVELSVCPFPAYEQTNISARKKSYEEYLETNLRAKKSELLERLKKNGVKRNNAQ